jgi:hypothetical protein
MGNKVPWLRSWPWTNRFIAIPPVHATALSYQILRFDTLSVTQGNCQRFMNVGLPALCGHSVYFAEVPLGDIPVH